MDINTDNDIEANENPGPPLSTPHFNAAMISKAHKVEPLNAKGGKSRPRSAGRFFRGRLAMVAVILLVLLLGAAAVGMVLGLRDRQSSVAEPAAVNLATPEPTNTDVVTPVVKAPVAATPAKVLTRAQRAETGQPDPKPIPAPERVRRTVRVSIDDIDRALSQNGQKPGPRKVGEIFGSGDRRDRKHKSKHSDDND